jgi:ribosomal protein S6--L-glutamate ligase
VDFRKLVASLGPTACTLELDGFDLMGVRGALVRGIPAGSLEQVVFRMDALHRLETAGIKVINSARSIEACVDKYLATARLQGQGLPIPRTIVCEGLEEAMAAFHHLGGDVVVKPLFGSEGRGILRAETEALAYRIFWTLFKLQSILYVQEFVEHPGYDLRLFVIGKRVAAGMKRYAANDFRTNVAQGGSFEAYVPTAEAEELAIRAAAAVGAEIAGVDLLTGPDHKPLVLEVNSTPGFQALAQTTEVDIAAAILRHVMSAIEQD